ncbi:hypothetical protein PoB_000555000 [Plakobranchus ocellatus]|uniref:Uncharacterized protein n=1 Tax=Plakobranchus ocellatus TaxID=259542 RepID=A0AAV3Y967_9GAST|nr:hypothetical protein PoB_000555000 [Plakobranchus ocellatus]
MGFLDSKGSGWEVVGMGKMGKGVGGGAKQGKRREKDRSGGGKGNGEGPVRGEMWGGTKKSAVRHQSPMCTVACPYEGRYVQSASVYTATVLCSPDVYENDGRNTCGQ